MPWLTKSRFLSGLQCAKRLWFEVYTPLSAGGSESMAMLHGRAVDHVARMLYPGVIVSRSNGLPAAIAETTRMLAEGAPTVLHQAAFRHADLAFVADLFRRSAGGSDLVEVKTSTAVKDEHLLDAAFQLGVLTDAGVPVSRVFIAHVNSEFVLQRAG